MTKHTLVIEWLQRNCTLEMSNMASVTQDSSRAKNIVSRLIGVDWVFVNSKKCKFTKTASEISCIRVHSQSRANTHTHTHDANMRDETRRVTYLIRLLDDFSIVQRPCNVFFRSPPRHSLAFQIFCVELFYRRSYRCFDWLTMLVFALSWGYT